MSRGDADITILGAGPVGCTAALACAREGRSVLLLEQDPAGAAEHTVGEWLHPPAMDVLDGLGVDLRPPVGYPTGRGFVLTPDDGTEPLVLPYAAGRFGFSLEHGLLVETLRTHVERTPNITYVPHARAERLEGNVVSYACRGGASAARSARVAIACGGGTRVLGRGGALTLGPEERPATHRLAAVTLVGVRLPFEGYHHLFVGGPGPAVAYRIGPARVRLLLDVPLSLSVPRTGGVALHDAFAPALPEALADALRNTLAESSPTWTQGRLRPRSNLAADGVARLGEAVGSVHPLTAANLTLGIGDALALSTTADAKAYKRSRQRAARIPETCALGLAELFTDDAPEILAIRAATYRTWRKQPGERLRSMGFLAGEGEGPVRFGRSCLRVAVSSALDVWRSRPAGDLQHTGAVSADMVRRVGWMVGGSLGWTDVLPDAISERLEARGAASRYGGALMSTNTPRAEVVGLPASPPTSVEEALRRGTDALVAEQAEDGSFEGEVVWCPMLAAQYVLACHVMDRPIADERRRLLLKHFENTQLEGGAWGLHEMSEPYLFVSALVYAAARLLGVDKDAPLLTRGRRFIRDEGGALGIPSWGKLWLALVGLYEWDGVNPVLPELWAAPRWLPVHPSRYYCHTRLIYLGMATLYGERVQRPATPTVRAIRDELFVEPYAEIDFDKARSTLRAGDVHVPPSPALKLAFEGLRVLDRVRRPKRREAIIAQLRERIRYELRSTSHTCISPVSGMLGILALHAADHNDPDVLEGLNRFEGWIWEDEEEGARVCGARSASWDTAFAAQALSAVSPFVDVKASLEGADRFLESQQIRGGTGREHENDRLDPTGGYCFAGVWHGWPVSDCTAEAVLGRLESPHASPTPEAMEDAIRFILRTQCSDGGFGSYEARRVDLPIDWLNPSEMFGACMTERSYIECTASCIAALAKFRERYPHRLRAEVDDAIRRAVAVLRRAQRPEGSFEGMWGVHFIYGTMFGVRGLLAGGVPSVDPQIRRACRFLAERQRPDGGWGEHHTSVFEGRYIPHHDAQVVQTAWALSTLVEAREPDFAMLERGARFLAAAQRTDGTWPKQDPEGIFFHTALLEYRLYRRYFPVWALGAYQRRARERQRLPRAASRPQARPN
ncbi:MAG: FAD-dependent oxidoreductase [Sandaracinaceae bacterium]